MKQLKEKLENANYATVYQIWDTYCNQEPPNQGQLISEIIDLVEKDEDVFEVVKNIMLSPEVNGFYNIPAECEGSECGDCMLVDYDRRAVDCPYIN